MTIKNKKLYIIMIKEKEVYTSPTTDVLELRFEASLLDASLTGSGFSEPNATEQDLSGANWW